MITYTKSAVSPTEWADAEIAKHRAWISDLEAYKRVVASGAPVPVERPQQTQLPPLTASNQTDPVSSEGRSTKKRAILESLEISVHGQTTQMVIAAITTKGIKDAKIENTSPQLSAYKADGLVDLTPNGWVITHKGREYLAATKD